MNYSLPKQSSWQRDTANQIANLSLVFEFPDLLMLNIVVDTYITNITTPMPLFTRFDRLKTDYI